MLLEQDNVNPLSNTVGKTLGKEVTIVLTTDISDRSHITEETQHLFIHDKERNNWKERGRWQEGSKE
jgi:hypothetical protein